MKEFIKEPLQQLSEDFFEEKNVENFLERIPGQNSRSNFGCYLLKVSWINAWENSQKKLEEKNLNESLKNVRRISRQE